MKHENRANIWVMAAFWVISCTQIGYSQHFNNHSSTFKPFLINKAADLVASVRQDFTKRMVLVENFVQPCISFFYYAGTENFTHQKLYHNPKVLVRKPVAEALQRVQHDLKENGAGLAFFDAYRPWSVTKIMWTIVADERYAANPATGSGHNRGIAVDVTLVNTRTGVPLPMPTPFDDFSTKAHHSYTRLPKNILRNRLLLRRTMEKYGFKSLATEWWHYSWPDPKKNSKY